MSPAPGAPGVVAVLTAAGSGSRLGSGGPKALVAVAGVSLLRRAALGLLAARVERVVVTAPPEAVDTFALQVRDLEGVRVVAGSHASRQASVALGLAAALEDLPNAEVVLVHDAARPLTPPEVVTRVIEAGPTGSPPHAPTTSPWPPATTRASSRPWAAASSSCPGTTTPSRSPRPWTWPWRRSWPAVDDRRGTLLSAVGRCQPPSEGRSRRPMTVGKVHGRLATFTREP